ncbi:hypothetical protein GCM10011490_22440 [Pseudoclavibacter endophyticus]|uniref:NAD-dependent epimerase/dehydratase family protein n=1 Tax=Pseudoclavibacter endophyticus TaxID=1778590 RepID=A0A6H9WC86_9MICO|nr:NAD-dependent epimerase/dehydratase family protein [Pseudoclavibacter endophyticus]KAB1648280.1 NAD-dependent epimerase/dehydratase family protein [Pseudoclavibacter endophyticus]GGA71280.1 hypothetical protein GCM10011490_22440 [Pseudoclavibacter endophyticus]
MRIVIVGATGNAGTSVLRALHDSTDVTHVLGIARRMPDRSAEPYRHAEWRSIDIAAASEADNAEADLADAFRDADAVIHLAWLIQPNTERDLLRRVNVEGTRRVARAVAAAGVGHLVVASSVGAYAPDRARTLRDETWARGGIGTSHYSVDKVAQERVLDEIEEQFPELIVTRLRPALIFQADAASEIQRYFTNSFLPMQLLKVGRPPVLPLPAGLRGVQAVHGEDIGRAYAAAVVARKHGAFNICADDVLTPRQLASIIDHGRVLRIPDPIVRASIAAAHRARAIAADPGWLDMALQVPMMTNAKAKRELGWEPRHSAAHALESLLDGLIAGHGTDSVPMRPRDLKRAHVPATTRAAVSSPNLDNTDDGHKEQPWKEADDRPADGLPEGIDRELFGLYLSDHLTGATAGAARLERMAAAYIDTPVYAQLSEVANQVRLEREFLRRVIDSLGVRPRRHRQATAWVGERVARLKANGRITRRSPMSLVLEAEIMRSAVVGKLGGWQVLRDHAELLELDPGVFDDLANSVSRQVETLDHVHAYARQRAFRTDRETFRPAEAPGQDAPSAEQTPTPSSGDDDNH